MSATGFSGISQARWLLQVQFCKRKSGYAMVKFVYDIPVLNWQLFILRHLTCANIDAIYFCSSSKTFNSNLTSIPFIYYIISLNDGLFYYVIT